MLARCVARVLRIGPCPRASAIAAALLAVSFLVTTAQADPVAGKTFNVQQPDGTPVDVRVWGDEFYTVVESMGGYTLVRDPATQEICYAVLSADATELLSTGVRAGESPPARLMLDKHIRITPEATRAAVRAARARFARPGGSPDGLPAGQRGSWPDHGNVRGITLLIDFVDQGPSILPTNVEKYCNQVGYTGYGNNGSIRDYFYDVSDGNLTYTNYVPATYYRAQHPKTWYEETDTPGENRPLVLVLEALVDLDASGFDFSQYDSNTDGIIDAVNVFYAGPVNNAWGEGLWPHAGWVSFQADGVETNRYQITNMGTSLRLRTFCHENGHMLLGWNDLYDYDFDSTGVGRFCLMSYGASDTNPQEPCAYMKALSGWSTVHVLTTPQVGLAVPSDANITYKFPHPTAANEYYMIENRQWADRDAALPGAGLAIWHVDEFGNNDHNEQTPEWHFECTLVQADGRWDLENDSNYGDATDLWYAPNYTTCTPYTDPNTNWWSGDASNLIVENVSDLATIMTFDFDIQQPPNGDFNGDGLVDMIDVAAFEDCYTGPDIAVPPPAECAPFDFDEDEDIDCDDWQTLWLWWTGPPTHPPVYTVCDADCNENAIPDEYEIMAGMAYDDDNNHQPDECQLRTPVFYDSGSRHVMTEVIGSSSLDVALHLTGDPSDPDVNCVSSYQQADGTLADTPFFDATFRWNRQPVRGVQVIPGAAYNLRVLTVDGLFTEAGPVSTWGWGDADNNGLVNFRDINLVVRGFQGDFSEATREAVDLVPCVTNRDVSFADISADVAAFQGQDYYSYTGCPAPCP